MTPKIDEDFLNEKAKSIESIRLSLNDKSIQEEAVNEWLGSVEETLIATELEIIRLAKYGLWALNHGVPALEKIIFSVESDALEHRLDPTGKRVPPLTPTYLKTTEAFDLFLHKLDVWVRPSLAALPKETDKNG